MTVTSIMTGWDLSTLQKMYEFECVPPPGEYAHKIMLATGIERERYALVKEHLSLIPDAYVKWLQSIEKYDTAQFSITNEAVESFYLTFNTYKVQEYVNRLPLDSILSRATISIVEKTGLDLNPIRATYIFQPTEDALSAIAEYLDDGQKYQFIIDRIEDYHPIIITINPKETGYLGFDVVVKKIIDE